MNNIRIKILKTEEKRKDGKPIFENVDFYKCWAQVMDLYSKEMYEAINSKKENAISVKIRYCKKLEELIKHKNFKVEINKYIYEIYHCDFSKFPKQYIILKCNMVN